MKLGLKDPLSRQTMCGFLVHRGTADNSRVKRRGPDCTSLLEMGPFTFVHNLLAITGTFTPQPFMGDDIVCLYNGEIYNHEYSRTDGEVLIPMYKQHGVGFARHLD